MKQSEVATLLAFISAFDRRTIGLADVEAWSALDVIQRNDLETCKEAVLKFFDQEPTERGDVPWLDPQTLRRMVRWVKRDRETAGNRLRAIGQETPVTFGGNGSICAHPRLAETREGNRIIHTCVKCNAITAEIGEM